MSNMTETYKLVNGRIEIIDCLKGFSICTIVLMHLMSFMACMPSVIVKLSAIGGTGVHVFFFCSGLGLYLSYLKRKMGYVDFLKKRFHKVYIPYIIIVIISSMLPWMYYDNDRFMALLSHVFQFKIFVERYEHSFGTQFWFVSTILQMYLLFIPMCRLKDRLKNNWLFVSLFTLISIAWWILCYFMGVSELRIWNSFCLQYIWEFALGFIAAEMLYDGKEFRFNRWLLAVMAVGGIGLQAGMAMASEVFKLFNDIPALIGYSSLALLFLNIGFVKSICRIISNFSYEFYLIHVPVIATVFYFMKPEGILCECIAGFASIILSLIIGSVYNRLVKHII